MYPKHVGIIMDGNRRFSKKLMKQPWKGHEFGHQKLKEVMEWCKEFGIRELTVFAFSMQNFNRPKKEFEFLMELFVQGLKEIVQQPEEFIERGLQIKFIGRLHLLPEPISQLIKEVQEATKNCNQYTVNIAVAYGGREELTDAMRSIASKITQGDLCVEDVDENLIREHLELQEEPDLIIRTGGDKRTSNFLAWQSIYSEWFFVDCLWPEFQKEDFQKCLDEFVTRERRFGK
jgi:tritrans,polycis-undecaprenyl-diphosphate synthase [geranylgeranyl-diphosphate specific]